VLRYVQPGHGEQGVGQYHQQDQQGARAFSTQEADSDSTEQGGRAEGTAGTDKLLSAKALGATYQVVLPATADKAKRAKGKGAPPPEDGIDPELVKRLNTVRAEGAKTQQNLGRGQSNCDRLAAGTRFTFQGYPDKKAKDFELVVVQVRHIASDQPSYGNAFVAYPLALGTYRPPQNVAKPQAAGMGTAKCVSSSKEEGAPVDSRPDGRIRVQMSYDTDRDVPAGKNSCWIRIAQPWAGATHGTVFLPRAGDEVVIVHENGDPDRPLAIGSVYNSANTAHLLATTPIGSLAKGTGGKTLQANRNVAGIRCGQNEIALSDASGGPLLYLKAQDKMCIEVTGEQTNEVKGNQTEIIGGNVKITVTGTVTISAKEIVLKGGASGITINDAGVQMKGKVVGVKADSGGGIKVGGGKINITKA
jgi:type VI secretion system secreted protein VgrG